MESTTLVQLRDEFAMMCVSAHGPAKAYDMANQAIMEREKNLTDIREFTLHRLMGVLTASAITNQRNDISVNVDVSSNTVLISIVTGDDSEYLTKLVTFGDESAIDELSSIVDTINELDLHKTNHKTDK